MKTLGIDIGTTTICAVLTDMDTREIIKVKTIGNDSGVKSENEWEWLQNPDRILEKCIGLVEEFKKTEKIDAIGVTGQMHGILYLNAQGRAVSSLYTWQDQSGNEPYAEGKSYAEYMQEQTGYGVAAGYGMATHYFHVQNQMLPPNAVTFCTIPDYVAMHLAGIQKPMLHQSMAASLGLYDLTNKCFDKKACENLGLRLEILPAVTVEGRVLGKREGGIPVATAFGDNQASYLGTVETEGQILINIGTGSQISVMTDVYEPGEDLEYRPYIGNQYLAVGASLCGGYSYALMKRFMENAAEILGVDPGIELYEKMNHAAEKVYKKGNSISVDTRFKGTRKQPEIKGTVRDITPENFLPQNLICAVLEGIVRELQMYYDQFPDTAKDGKICYVSGNGVRKNPLMRRMIEDLFQKKPVLGKYLEEAAYGVSLFAAQTANGGKEKMQNPALWAGSCDKGLV